MYSQNLVTRLNRIAHDYRTRIEHAVKEVLSQQRYMNTGAGLDSLKVEVIDGNQNRAPDIRVTIADHIKLLNYRRMQWTGMPPIDNLDAWGETKTFEFVPGYKNGLAPNLPPWKAKERVIWAIAKSKQKFDSHKPKPWRKKSLSSVLKEMNKQVLLEFEMAIEADLQEAINEGING